MAKYEEMTNWSSLWGDDYFVYDRQEIDGELHIYLKSRPHSCACPVCGVESDELHATYERTLQTIPVMGRPTYPHVRAYRYDCVNEGCDVRVFSETLPFAHSRQQRTDELNSLIMGMSIFMSSEGTSRVLEQLGVRVSNDTIGNLWKLVEFRDDGNVENLGIDDVSLRKGQKYMTVFYDADDGHLIGMVRGRSADDVKEWLRKHPKIRRVARDRASAYAKAIKEILPEAIQVADRFHLMQNLLEYLDQVFKEDLPQELFVSEAGLVDAKDVEWRTEVVDAAQFTDVSELEYDNTPPTDENGQEIVFDAHKHGQSKSAKRGAENRKKNSR